MPCRRWNSKWTPAGGNRRREAIDCGIVRGELRKEGGLVRQQSRTQAR